MRRLMAAGAAALVLAATGAARGETRVVPLEGVSVIDNGAGSYRAALKFAPIQGIEDMAISRAYLAVNTERRGGETAPIEVQVHPITRDWVPGSVTWTRGWSRPGGDFADEMYARAEVQPQRLGEEVRVDVEALVREMRYGARFYGFVVTALPYERLGLRTADLLRLPGLSTPRLVVEYEAVPHVRLPEWVR